MFAKAISDEIRQSEKECLVMLQDYHLYLVPHFLRREFRNRKKYTLTMFIHIPWPGPEDWAVLPPRMRRAILESLCNLDMIGLQTREDGLNLLRTVESFLPEAHVNFRHGRIWYRNRSTHVRDFPISIDVQSLRELAESEEVHQYFEHLQERWGSRQLIVRVDRTEPSKNIVRGFQAFDEMLALHPEHLGKVQFLALMVPSRIEVSEYQGYLDELMAAAGRINVKYGDSEWEPVRILVGNNYARAVAVLQLYDVLLVNSLADGMNLVAKEGPIVNHKDGVVILSERTGARQQLETGAIVIPPIDIYATAEALHQALVMTPEERHEKTARLVQSIEREDIFDWLCKQLQEIVDLRI
jgi:trehalose 6-phosphate synthase